MTTRRRMNAALPMVLASIGICIPLAGCSSDANTSEDEPLSMSDDVETSQSALGTTYQVGPSRTYKTISAVTSLLQPGDVVEVDGNATYAGGIKFSKAGTVAAPITIRGVRVSGKRPVLSGGTNTVEMNQNNYVLEGFDITGGSTRCVFHHGNNITIRDSVIHDCPGHGVLGADEDSGSLTMQYVEVHHAGAGTTKHPVYIATDQKAYPGSVFRMEHCYVHDGNGGNNVKSRAERNEIYYNWIEGSPYKELELIGPDGTGPGKIREDSDVVGNVFRKVKAGFAVRIGGDTGDGDSATFGRYRFVNNTFILASGSNAAIHLFDGIESVETHNNVFFNPAGGSVTVFRDEADWVKGALHGGNNNWVPTGTSTPGAWSNTKTGSDPGFINAKSNDVRLTASSPLVNAGLNSPPTLSSAPFTNGLATPKFVPPLGKIEAVNTAQARPVVGVIDIGAFEYGTSSGGGTGGSSGAGGSSGTGGSSGGAGGSSGSAGTGGSAGSAAGGAGGSAGAGGSSGGTGGSTGGSAGSTGGTAGAGGSSGGTGGSAGAGGSSGGSAGAGGSSGGSAGAGGSSGGSAGAGGSSGGSAGAGGSGSGNVCAVASPSSWRNESITAQTGKFTATWDITPQSSNVDGALALSSSQSNRWPGLATIVRFANGRIDVRDGNRYAASRLVALKAGVTYRVRIEVDIAAHTYSVFVTEPGKREVSIARHFAFRDEQKSISTLRNWVGTSDSGTLKICEVNVP